MNESAAHAPAPPAPAPGALYRWTSLGLAAAMCIYLAYSTNTLRGQVDRTMIMVNDHLGQILVNTKASSETLAVLAADIKALRDLSGSADRTRDRSLVTYADDMLDRVQASGGIIGVKKLLGSGIKDPTPVEEWVVDARKEALWLSFRARSETELLERLTQTKFGSDWLIQVAGAEPVPLSTWLLPPTDDE